MHGFIVEYGLIIEYGPAAAIVILSALGGALTRYVFVSIESKIVSETLGRLWDEVRAAVLEVSQTYTDALREANEDGKLTEAEKRVAKEKAIAIAKSNIGKKGLRRLARVLDVNKWIGGKIEAFIGDKKAKANALTDAAAPGPGSA
ncbi:MAG: hypothetical protein GY811_23455 [Myxococcales bacterium]|nr:hypothetical protein [Myxococcales bacterium]